MTFGHGDVATCYPLSLLGGEITLDASVPVLGSFGSLRSSRVSFLQSSDKAVKLPILERTNLKMTSAGTKFGTRTRT